MSGFVFVYPRSGAEPRIARVVREDGEGWTVEPLNLGNPDIPVDRAFLPKSDWTLSEAEWAPAARSGPDPEMGVDFSFDPAV